jgi:hypothetical protein
VRLHPYIYIVMFSAETQHFGKLRFYLQESTRYDESATTYEKTFREEKHVAMSSLCNHCVINSLIPVCGVT